MTKYRCPQCKVEADIDVAARTMHVTVQIPTPKPGARILVVGFPSHKGCELAKPIDKIDLSKLEAVA